MAEFKTLDDFAPQGFTVGTGDAATDQAAFEQAMLYMNTGPDSGGQYTAPAVFVRPGKYSVTGALGGAVDRINLFAEPRSVIIEVTQDAFLLEIADRLDSFRFSGFTVIGGRGVLHHTWTGNNVTAGVLVFEHNVCLDYTVAALCSEAADAPYWRVRDNTFAASATAPDCKGVVLGGLLDDSVIERNAFTRNDTHLQVGPLHSGTLIIQDNDFISVQAGRTDRDIWLIPSVQPWYGTNAGQGTTIRNNKFGNEGISSLDKKAPRLLVAAAAGTSRTYAVPDLSWKKGADGLNWLLGLSIEGNRITTASLGTTGGADTSFAQIYIEKMGQVTFAGDNVIDGGRFNYLFEFVVPQPAPPPPEGQEIVRSPDRNNTNWDIRLGGGLRGSYGAPFKRGVSNSPVGLIQDPFGIAPSPNATLPFADPLASVLASATGPGSWYVEPGIDTPLPAATNVDGSSTATLVTWSQQGPLVVLALPDLTAHANKNAWIVGNYKGGATSATDIQVRLESYIGEQQQVYDTHPVDGTWRTLATSFVIPPAHATTMQLRIGILNWTGAANQIVLGNFKVVVGRSPLPVT